MPPAVYYLAASHQSADLASLNHNGALYAAAAVFIIGVALSVPRRAGRSVSDE